MLINNQKIKKQLFIYVLNRKNFNIYRIFYKVELMWIKKVKIKHHFYIKFFKRIYNNILIKFYN